MRNMRKKRTPERLPEGRKQKKELAKADVALLLAFLGATVVAITVYRFLMQGPYFYIVLGIYLVLGTVSALGYVLYNRGFSRKGLTPDMLPADWSDEKKAAFLTDGERRLARSRWILILAFAIFFTLALDMVELYVIPTFRTIFGGGR